MKKILANIIIFLLAMLSFTACGFRENVVPTPDVDMMGVGKMPQGSETSQKDDSKFIDEEKAKELALEKAGVGADGVKFDRIELDRDNGIWQYEVDFRSGDVEYDIDIKADTGEVLSFEKEEKAGF
ncbi:MAG: PepSY domain-containing protein [Clostridia bacterium]|nr:PepSY domain-containing protein [Clostridia bacterium]